MFPAGILSILLSDTCTHNLSCSAPTKLEQIQKLSSALVTWTQIMGKHHYPTKLTSEKEVQKEVHPKYSQ